MTAAHSLRPADRERISAAATEARAHAPPHLDTGQRRELSERAAALLEDGDAVLIAHYYVDDSLQDLADATGGCVADSLEMARFGAAHAASTLVVAGVRFMGETAKILSPDKRVLLLDTDAECSLDIGCPADRFSAFCDAHPDRTVVVYANTSAAVKARADWVVTSSVALPIVRHLHHNGEKILWAPDRYLGDYVQRKTGADMLMWNGSCIVHEEFKAGELLALKSEYPDARVLVHPESPPGVIALADVVGSTSRLIQAVKEGGTGTYIVATEDGIFHRMHQVSPGSRILAAPTAGRGATCKSCAHCPWMKLNDLRGLINVLDDPGAAAHAEVHVEEDIRVRAVRSLQRMLDFARTHQPDVPVAGNA